jgi:hypothetical protein
VDKRDGGGNRDKPRLCCLVVPDVLGEQAADNAAKQVNAMKRRF